MENLRMNNLQWKMKTDIGNIYLVASEEGLEKVYLSRERVPMALSLESNDIRVKILAQAVRELGEYFEGRRQTFEVKLAPKGTAFQKRVWTQLSKIPYGETCSYRDIAARIKNAKAVRAVGGANGKNPLCIIVPCHRVIAADGTLGGYSGGLHIKTKLLKLESRKNLGA
jgi:methylated-DNA-[protein]-cysteine S-methyltransferase